MIDNRVTHQGRPRSVAGRQLTALAALVLVTVACLGMAPASAAGDPTVDHYILKNPVPGWNAAPAAVGQAVATAVTAALGNEKASVAVDGWNAPSPSRPRGELLILLERFPGSSVPASAASGPSQLATDMCSGAGATPGLSFPLSGIPDSASETCLSTTLGSVTSVAWVQANVAAFIFSAGLPVITADQIAQQESALVPASGISESSFPYALVGGTAVVVVLIVLVIVLRVRRRKTVAASAGGWPVQAGSEQAWGYASGFDAGQASAPAAEPPAWAESAGPAPWAAAAGPVAQAPSQAATYAQAATAYGQAAPWDSAVISGSPATGPAPYAPSRPSQRTAGQSSYGGTQSFPGATDLAFTSPGGAADRAAGPPGRPPGALPVDIGWYPADGDPYRQSYWDGDGWSASLRWDGSSWVEDS